MIPVFAFYPNKAFNSPHWLVGSLSRKSLPFTGFLVVALGLRPLPPPFMARSHNIPPNGAAPDWLGPRRGHDPATHLFSVRFPTPPSGRVSSHRPVKCTIRVHDTMDACAMSRPSQI
jgi:hypothetical protein